MTFRIGFIGCVKSSRAILNVLVRMPEIEICAVVTKNSSKTNSDFDDLTDICEKFLIPYHYELLNEKTKSYNFLASYNIDLIYCFGWSYLLSDEILSLPRLGVVGFHPAKLPKNRGRHPIIWAIALGLKETASTFFKMDSGVDSGPILSQKNIKMYADEYAVDLYDRVIDAALDQVKTLTLEFVKNEVNPIVQDETRATYWRKRSRADGLIDWRMSAQTIYNLIRALAPPYPCAEFRFGEKFIKVSKCSIILGKFPENIEPGYILEKGTNSLLVKVEGSDAVLLEHIEYDLNDGRDYI